MAFEVWTLLRRREEFNGKTTHPLLPRRGAIPACTAHILSEINHTDNGLNDARHGDDLH